MLAFLKDWSDRELRQKPEPNTWNALQVLEHVIGSEKGTLGYMLKKTQADVDSLEVATDKNQRESEKLNEVLQSTHRYQKPEVLPDPNGDNAMEEYRAAWNQLNKEYWKFFESLDEDYLDKQLFRHPFSGKLNAFQTLDFLIHHITHHMHQLNRIKQAQ